MTDRIADPWGARTPYDPSDEAGASAVAGARRPVARGRSQRCRRRPLGSECRCPALQRRRARHRGQGRAHRRRAREGRRSRQSRPRRPQGSLRLAGQQLRRSPHPSADPRGRRARRDRLGHGDGAHRRALAGAARGRWRLGALRLLHERPALPRGVLHARGDRQGGPRHAAHGRQHAALHRDRRGGAQGELRHRRATGLLHATSTTATRSRCGVTTSPRRRPSSGCACSTAGAAPTRRGCSPWIRGRRRWRARPTSTSRSATARTRR